MVERADIDGGGDSNSQQEGEPRKISVSETVEEGLGNLITKRDPSLRANGEPKRLLRPPTPKSSEEPNSSSKPL